MYEVIGQTLLYLYIWPKWHHSNNNGKEYVELLRKSKLEKKIQEISVQANVWENVLNSKHF